MASTEEPVQPLRITKSPTPTTAGTTNSANKMASGIPRPLSEIPPTAQRRNSPSWRQIAGANNKMAQSDSSPFQTSPPTEPVASPRMFWQNRNNENSIFGRNSGSPVPPRRTSIERLQKASRVKNSNIFALEQKHEYDPSRPISIDRPLSKIQSNVYANHGNRVPDVRAGPVRGSSTFGHGRSKSDIPALMRANTSPPNLDDDRMRRPETPTGPTTPSRTPSPMKSSLSTARSRGYDPETGAWTGDMDDDGKSSHRHAKSVTFDAAPPQVNEYEMVTPDISSLGSNSREGSYDDESVQDDEDDSALYNLGREHDIHEDSFDASLEDVSKTPVLGPDDWRHDSPASKRDDHYDSSPMPETPVPQVSRPLHNRTNSATSSAEHRPLPPLPGEAIRASTNSPVVNGSDVSSPRSLPSPPPPASSPRSDTRNIGNGKMTLEERLKLMMSSDDGKTAAELQRERRLRRGGNRDKFGSPPSESSGSANASVIDHKDEEEEDEDDQEDDADADADVDADPDADAEPDADDDDDDDDDDTLGEISGLGDLQLPPRISRESIMRRVDGNRADEPPSDLGFSPQAPQAPKRELLPPFNPDIPLPTTEDDDSSFLDQEVSELDPDDELTDDEQGSVIVRRKAPSHDEVSEISDEEYDRSYSDTETEDISRYSNNKALVDSPENLKTPRVSDSSFQQNIMDSITELTIDEPQPEPQLKRRSSADMAAYMLPEPPEAPEEDADDGDQDEGGQHKKVLDLADAPVLRHPHTSARARSMYDGSGWGDPEEATEDFSDPGTPESVIRHPVSDPSELLDDDVLSLPEPPTITDPEMEANRPSPSIPENLATIKSASGSKLKTRPSATPSDISAMREARRHVSREIDVPPIPERHRNRLSREMDGECNEHEQYLTRHPSFRNKSLQLDLDLGLSLDQDFDRVIEAQKVAFSSYSYSFPVPEDQQQLSETTSAGLVSAATTAAAGPAAASTTGQASGGSRNLQDFEKDPPSQTTNTASPQRGYLMRQNTKLVAASDKEDDYLWKSRSAVNSPGKKDRPQSWTVEPWNPARAKKTPRVRPNLNGPVPPLPGQESNASVLGPVTEDETVIESAPEESGERGRLFVKVVGVKDLDLPLPKNERTWFSLTLDNGVHCVTTAWLELARNAPIGQEFELVVPNDLEFQLTLNVKLEKPAAPAPLPATPSRTMKPKTSTFSRVFASPKKRKEMELRAREEEERLAQQQRDAMARQKNVVPTGWDLLSPLTAEDGSFARAYICLKEHEGRCFGRPYSVDVACFNEWATEEAGFASSVKSKRGNTAVVRRAPYKVGKLELQLLFVPRPKGACDDDMPKSMNSCIREIKAAEERLSRNWEGHLSQQGGDCPYWRRRYFKLVGPKLTAYHEATRQPRATINLSNAKRLIDDRQTLTEKEITGKNGRRRRSAFAEEEDGYMFVEEGFRIRFNNGECIDFYADTAEDKEGWMRVLSDVIGRDTSHMVEDTDSIMPKSRGKWCELVLKREETLRRRTEGRRVHSRTKSMYL